MEFIKLLLQMAISDNSEHGRTEMGILLSQWIYASKIHNTNKLSQNIEHYFSKHAFVLIIQILPVTTF